MLVVRLLFLSSLAKFYLFYVTFITKEMEVAKATNDSLLHGPKVLKIWSQDHDLQEEEDHTSPKLKLEPCCDESMLDHVQSQTLKKHQLKPQKLSLLEEENVGSKLLGAKMTKGVHCQTTILCTL
jgi:hypothetical protein